MLTEVGTTTLQISPISIQPSNTTSSSPVQFTGMANRNKVSGSVVAIIGILGLGMIGL